MRKLIGSAVLSAALMAMPALAAAQHSGGMMAPKHEFGVDLAAFWAHQSLGGVSASNFNVVTPVDVRVNFVSEGSMSFEPRLSFAFASAPSGGNSSHTITPDLNVLIGMGKAKARNDNKYFTVGVGANLVGAGGTSYSQLTLNGGVGMRSPYESGAFRLEAFVAYFTKNTANNVPSTLAIGARIGLSLWH